MPSAGAQLFRESASLLHHCHPTGLLQLSPRPLLFFPICSKGMRTTANVLFSSFCSSPLQSKQIWGFRNSGTLENSKATDRNKFVLSEILFQNMVCSTILVIIWKLWQFSCGRRKQQTNKLRELAVMEIFPVSSMICSDVIYQLIYNAKYFLF